MKILACFIGVPKRPDSETWLSESRIISNIQYSTITLGNTGWRFTAMSGTTGQKSGTVCVAGTFGEDPLPPLPLPPPPPMGPSEKYTYGGN